MKLSTVIEYLSQQVSDLTGRVEGAMEFAALLKTDTLPQTTPHAFIIPLGATAGPNTLSTGAHMQRLTERFGVMLVLNAPADPKARRLQVRLETLIDDVVQALTGFTSDADHDPFEFKSGELTSLNPKYGVVFYELQFETQSYIRKVN